MSKINPSKATSADIEKKLITARVQMLMRSPFFGNLACRLKLVDATKWLPTCATDGRHFYYNRDFVDNLSRPELTFVFCHEVLHCAYSHMDRKKSRDSQLWNEACDFVINLEIKDAKVGEMPKAVVEGEVKYVGLLDDKFRGLASNQVYDLLKKMKDEDPKAYQKLVGPGNFDQHSDSLQDAAEKGTDPTGENGPIPLSDDEKERIRDEVRQSVLQAAKTAGAGNTPAGITRMVGELTEPKMDWREMLNVHIQSALKDDYTFLRPSRKGTVTNVRLPGMKYAEKISIACCIDVSGSISDDMVKDFLGEVHGIMTQFDDFEILVWSFDTKVYRKTMLKLTPDTIEDIFNYKMVGGGGTDFMCNWQFMEEDDIVPHKLVMFTDGYPGSEWGNPDYCDTLFVIHGNDKIIAPFGTTCHYDFNK